MFITGKGIDFINDIELDLYCRGEGVCLSELKKAAVTNKKQNFILKLFSIIFK